MGEPRAELWDVLARWRSAGRRFVLATVVETRGFTPQKGGARMLIAAGGETWGTIGGGAIEQEAIGRARALLEDGEVTLLKRHLTQELGMCCGGEMSVFLEVIEAAPRLTIFGAGYIAKPLAAIAAGCGFDVTVVDARAEWASEERFPHARLKARGFSAEQIARLHTPLGLDVGARTPEEIAVSVVAQLVAVRRGKAIEPGWALAPAAGASRVNAVETGVENGERRAP